ncbi:MAG: hypothetical protein ACREOO_21830 [bacterium]
MVRAVQGKKPLSARHAMGMYTMEKTGNVTALQQQPDHNTAAYSLQDTQNTSKKLGELLNGRQQQTTEM